MKVLSVFFVVAFGAGGEGDGVAEVIGYLFD